MILCLFDHASFVALVCPLAAFHEKYMKVCDRGLGVKLPHHQPTVCTSEPL
jgi:hypothetical protein